MIQWTGLAEPVIEGPKGTQWLSVIWRGCVMSVATLGLLVAYALVYSVEILFPSLGWSRRIIRWWSRLGLYLTGMTLEVRGTHMTHGGALVTNHTSWQDIFTLGSAANVSFVAKSEVRRWPVIGFLARITGTLFIERRTSQAKHHRAALVARLERGDQLCFFPEGTSTDGQRVIRFRSTLFSAFHTPETIAHVWVQPASVTYFPENGLPANFYGWWGDMPFGAHVLAVLACSHKGRVRVKFHAPVRAADFATRKDIAAYCERVVREGLRADLEAISAPA